MSFSFNPGQTAEAGTPMSGGVSVPGATEAQNTALAVPDSPFLFMQQRGQEMSTGAYIQIVLIMLSILSVAVSIVLFAYSMYLTTSIDNKKETLLTKDAPFKDYPLEDMKRLSLRFNVLGGILQNYVSVRTPLKMLEDVVEKQVVFEKFSVTKSTAFGQGEAYVMNFSLVTSNLLASIGIYLITG